MSGPKADAILARSTDPSVKKKRKKVKNEDYPSGPVPGGSQTGGLMFKDEEDEWKRRIGGDEMDLDGEDAPGEWTTVGYSRLHTCTDADDSRWKSPSYV